MGSSNKLAVALDLVRAQYVCAPADPADPRMTELRRKSWCGDRTLVCALCYTELGQHVPLIVRGRIAGERRPHFAHPRGHGPVGGQHQPESLWHLTSKAVLAEWARRQPGVIDVRNEAWLPNHERRADVRVQFVDGSQIALEVQGSPLTDDDWQQRHHDYRRNQIVDVWLWHPDSPPHWVVFSDPDRSQQLWTIDPKQQTVSLMVAAPHGHVPGQSTAVDEITYRVRHLPPCTGDRLVPHTYRLDELTLTDHGILVPASLQRLFAAELQHERDRAERARQLPDPAPPVTSRPPATPVSGRVTPTMNTRATNPVAADPEACAQLRWIELQNAFMKAGHRPAYQDSPRLRLPRVSRPTVQCIDCGQVLSPTAGPTTIEACTSFPNRSRLDNEPKSAPPAESGAAPPLSDSSLRSRAISPTSIHRGRHGPTKRSRAVNPDQLPLF
ncbi:hypothetical protein IU501_09030 [Nocardia otitidiscaviarum]|uniref:competence protein CoiA family protein n=1 Tax=Nocardia otitidiscaviarum TaxID=1823 RepID=UPI0011DE48EE|nr:competence protein CoiA family protein [Nocardia otitidiscaviarum]MBF6133142.1 hypothetical protein [Nocardia otitidiscaviarum]MBF6486538.1 hypothetical protein [Nocardia otitidiscaviarum]